MRLRKQLRLEIHLGDLDSIESESMIGAAYLRVGSQVRHVCTARHSTPWEAAPWTRSPSLPEAHNTTTGPSWPQNGVKPQQQRRKVRTNIVPDAARNNPAR